MHKIKPTCTSSPLLSQATLTILDKLDIETENPTEEEVAEKFGFLDAYQRNDLSIWQRTKPKMYSLFDEPHSSSCAKVSGENKPSWSFFC